MSSFESLLTPEKASSYSGYGAAAGYASEIAAVAPIDESNCVSRSDFVRFLQWRSQRSKVLRQVPVALFFYFVFCLAIVLRARVGVSYELESQLLSTVVNAGDGFAPSTASDWYDFVDSTLVQAVLPWTSTDGSDLPPEQLGRLANGQALIIGGVRLVQTRRAPSPCELGSSALNALYGGACYSDDTSTSTPFGNLTLAAQLGVAGAFVASTVGGDDEGPKYQLFLNPQDGVDALSAAVNGLRAAGWLDGGSDSVSVQIAVLNGNIGLFGRVELTAAFTRGGLLEASSSVQSLPVDPYLNAGYNVLFDLVLLGMWLYLLIGTARRLAKATWGDGAPLRSVGWLGTARHVLWHYWRLLDVATTLSVIVTLGLWWTVVDRLSAIRVSIDNSDPDGPASFAGGPSPLAQNVLEAHAAFASFEMSSVVSLVFLTLRLFKYFRLHPRLAAVADGISKGFSDFLHVALVFGIVLAAFGVIGHFGFGSQAPAWRTSYSSCLAVFKASLYEYDLEAMEAAFPALADIYFAALLILTSNLLYWLAFAAFFASYDEAREAAKAHAPSAFSDLAAYAAKAPVEAYALAAPRIVDAARWAGVGHVALRWLPPAPAAGVGTLSTQLLVRVKGGALAGTEVVTAPFLAAAFGLTPDSAVAVIAEAQEFLELSAADAAPAAAAAGAAEASGDDDVAAGGYALLAGAPQVPSQYQASSYQASGSSSSSSSAATLFKRRGPAAVVASADGDGVAAQLVALREAVALLSAQLAAAQGLPVPASVLAGSDTSSPGASPEALIAAAREAVLQRQASGMGHSVLGTRLA